MSLTNDPYQVLGLSPRAEDVVIRAAFKALLRKYHPDLCNDPQASERTRAITEAFRVLGDPQRRAVFDRARQTGHRPPPPPPRPAQGPRQQPQPSRPAPQPKPVDRAARRRRVIRSLTTLVTILAIGIGGAFGARALLQEHPHMNALLHDRLDQVSALFSSGGQIVDPGYVPPPAPVPLPVLATVERGSGDAMAVVGVGGENAAITASRTCGTKSKNDVEMADYCTAFDIAAATALGAMGKPSAYFADAPSRAITRYNAVDVPGPEARADQVRAIVVPDALSRIDQLLEDRLASARRGSPPTR